VLSAVLHAVSMGPEGRQAARAGGGGRRAAGAGRSAGDYANALTALLRDSDAFPVVRRVFAFADGCARGCCSLAALRASWARAVGSSVGVGDVNAAAMGALLDAMGRSWAAMGVDEAAEIHVGFINTRAASLHAMTTHVFDELHRRRTVGTDRASPLHVHHHHLLLHTTLANRITAVDELNHVTRRLRDWTAKYGSSGDTPYIQALAAAPPGEVPADAAAVLRLRQGAAPETAAGAAAGEPFIADHWCIKDVANFFPEVPGKVRRSAAASYAELCELAKPVTSEMDNGICWALGLPLLGSNAEADAALAFVRDTSHSFRRIHRSKKQMIRGAIRLAELHPPRGSKMAAADVAERRKWFMYYEARDTALTLFAQSRAGREAMKELYHGDNRLTALRDAPAIAADCAAAAALFPFDAPAAGAAAPRLTPPLMPTWADTVPRHLSDPAVANPYPHVKLRIAATAVMLDDPFPAVLAHLKSMDDQWWLTEPDMFVSLLRCHIHRLDWAAAARLTENVLPRLRITAEVDSAILQIFDEIGDPAGGICFKMATKIFDGRIQENAPRGQPGRRVALHTA
jgi:hypothetical protein